MDDNATKRDVLAGLLKHWGCRYEDAPDAETALEKLHHAVDAGDPFHIAILDMLMPHTDGETLGRLIRDESAFIDTALVMMTSGGKRGDAGRLEQIGFDAYLTKPVRRAHLSDTLLTILGRTADYSAPSGLITRYSIDEDQRRKVRILLAEDNVINQKVALKMLENMGYRADAVANGLEAVTALQTIPYDLVLMDIQMPEMDGLEATPTIRNLQSSVSNSTLPIIAVTAHTMKGDREKCLEAGMDDYLSKPIQSEELTEILAQWAYTDLSREMELSDFTSEEPASVFDTTALLERLDGDETLCEQVISLFLEDLPGRMDVLEDAIGQSDRAQIRSQAHAIKGVAGTVGATAIQEMAQQIEESAELDTLDQVEVLVKIVRKEYKRLKKTIQVSPTAVT